MPEAFNISICGHDFQVKLDLRRASEARRDGEDVLIGVMEKILQIALIMQGQKARKL